MINTDAAQMNTQSPSSPDQGQGHGPFSEEDIQEIMAATGYDYQTVCADIDRTGATTKEALYPNVFQGTGIQPQAETVGPGAVQGPPPDARAQAQAAMQGNAPPPIALAEASEGEAPETPQAEASEGEGIPPEVAQAMHKAMAPPTRKRIRR